MCVGLNPKKIECIVNQIRIRNLGYSINNKLTVGKNNRLQLNGSGKASILSIVLENVPYTDGNLNKLASIKLNVDEDVIVYFVRGLNSLNPQKTKKCCDGAYWLGRKYSTI